MKKSLLALAVLGAFAGAASAQSSVTVYGIVDLGITSLDNGNAAGRVTGVTSGNQSASRIGFKGTEDLGGGLNALFQLEATIAADTGAAFATGTGNNGGFNRLATVGLQSNAFGTVNLGRQTSVIKDAYDAIDPFGDGGTISPISTVFFNGTLGGDQGRISNSVKYTSNSFGGFKANAAYAFGETAGDTGANSSYGLGLAYVNGPLNVQFGYHNADTSTFANPSVQQSENKLTFLGATYNFGVVKLHGAYADTKLENTVANTETKYRNYLVGVSVPVGAAGNVFASYSVNDNRSANDADAKKAAIMYTYDLSKRTNLYTGYSHTSNDTNSRIGLAAIGSNAAGVTGESGSAFAVGVRHKF
ncbi:porin [Herminiimonas fonticola]|uniref:Putative porin n=1 Tax=Herminiimonas fonticola TaxID=303380 RepID=A0A4R6G380_9BURK|nr:porin [Herminiimonas fonticola]RBA23137.1 Gram-negative porin [Herminiimonas fonticola]TDN88856.1 putative porin [Herminiimonas fonticola]